MREWLENASLRNHGVNLERVQRIHLGIDYESMDFTAETIASMLQDVADQCDENEAFAIHAVVRALQGKDDHHQLVLRQKRPGRFESPTEWEEKSNRNSKWLYWLAGREKKGWKTEAAIAEIAEQEGVSRATVFAGIREAEDSLARGNAIFPDSGNFENPRPDKKRNT